MMILAVLAVNTFLQMFGGQWSCAGTPWSITATPGDAWARVKWGDQSSKNGGVAYVGFIAQEKQWVYEDFHYDGSFALTTSKGPDEKNAWTWAGGGYYTKDAVLHGRVVWRLVSPTEIERTFTTLDAQGNPDPAHPPQSDRCSKS